LGWAASARVICSGVQSILRSEYVLQARAAGSGTKRLLLKHILPNLAPALLAQFWISIPVFILAEANLGILGLGVAEPLPSWGGLLGDLQELPNVAAEPWKLAPLLLLAAVVASFELLLNPSEVKV
jgi:peptide/nickel transport system permease protein